jgi:hypothetical protein
VSEFVSRSKDDVFSGPRRRDEQVFPVTAQRRHKSLKSTFVDRTPPTDCSRDMITDIHLIETRTGQVSNPMREQYWRIDDGWRYSDQIIKWRRTASRGDKVKLKQQSEKAALARKHAELQRLLRKTGIRLEPRTIGVIINPDKHIADLFNIPGFHARIGWKSDLAQQNYTGTISYELKCISTLRDRKAVKVRSRQKSTTKLSKAVAWRAFEQWLNTASGDLRRAFEKHFALPLGCLDDPDLDKPATVLHERMN